MEHGHTAGIDLNQVLRPSATVAPWNFFEPDIDVSLSSYKTLPPYRLFELAEHAGEYFVYTDGSRDDEHTGYAVVFPSHSIKVRLHDECSIYQAELLAIRAAIRIAPNLTDGRICVVSDSLDSLLSIGNFNNHDDLVKQIQYERRATISTLSCFCSLSYGVERKRRG